MWYSTRQLERQHTEFVQRTHNLSEDDRQKAWEAELEKNWQTIQDCVLAFKAGQNICEGGRFDTLSLGTWYELMRLSSLEFAAVPIAFAGTADLVGGVQNPVFPLTLPKMAKQYRGMVRLDSCGSALLKQAFSYRGESDNLGSLIGAVENDGQWYFSLDERTLNGLMTYVGQIAADGAIECPIWWRPWVSAVPITVARPDFMGKHMTPDVWPLEWRVIVQQGRITGISAYYIQAPVTYTDFVHEHLVAIKNHVDTLLDTMTRIGAQPWHPCYNGEVAEDDVSFTCDFISTETGPLWLESGPRVPVDENNIPVPEWGAHPCNFMNLPIQGIALSSTDVRSFQEL